MESFTVTLKIRTTVLEVQLDIPPQRIKLEEDFQFYKKVSDGCLGDKIAMKITYTLETIQTKHYIYQII